MAKAQNKTVENELSPKQFLDAVEDEARRDDAKALAKLMQTATGEKPKMWGPAIVGFGSRHYVYESGREGDTPLVAFSPRKAALVLYGLSSAPGAAAALAKLGKHATGKGCVYVKKLADVDPQVLRDLIDKALAAALAKG